MAQFEVGCCVEDLTKENSWKQEAANSPGFSSDSTGLAGDTSKGPQEKHGTSQSAVFESFQTHKRYQTITPKGLRPNTVAGRTHPAHQNGHRDGLGLAGDVNCDVAPFRAGAAFFLASCHMEEAEKRNTQAETKTHTHTHPPQKVHRYQLCMWRSQTDHGSPDSRLGDPEPTGQAPLRWRDLWRSLLSPSAPWWDGEKCMWPWSTMCVSNFGKRLRFVHNAKIYRLIWDPGRRNQRIHEFMNLKALA